MGITAISLWFMIALKFTQPQNYGEKKSSVNILICCQGGPPPSLSELLSDILYLYKLGNEGTEVNKQCMITQPLDQRQTPEPKTLSPILVFLTSWLWCPLCHIPGASFLTLRKVQSTEFLSVGKISCVHRLPSGIETDFAYLLFC